MKEQSLGIRKRYGMPRSLSGLTLQPCEKPVAVPWGSSTSYRWQVRCYRGRKGEEEKLTDWERRKGEVSQLGYSRARRQLQRGKTSKPLGISGPLMTPRPRGLYPAEGRQVATRGPRLEFARGKF